MDDLRGEGLVIRDTLVFREVRDEPSGELLRVNVRGWIACADRAVIAVNKWLMVRRGPHNRYEVKGEDYSYHAWVRGNPRRELFRYDSAHGLDRLHRHVFDEDGRETDIIPVSLDALPRLDLVVHEAVGLAGSN